MRPLPGSARMYPETDVPVRFFDDDDWERVQSNMPPSAEERLANSNLLGFLKIK